MSGIDRTQILRIDCPKCHGNGYIRTPQGEEACPEEAGCGGSGVITREVPYKFETHGRYSKEEIAEHFGVSTEDVKDGGHSTGE